MTARRHESSCLICGAPLIYAQSDEADLACTYCGEVHRADARCAEQRPELRPVDGRLVACHHAETEHADAAT